MMPVTIYDTDIAKGRKVMENSGILHIPTLIAQAIAEERERCATIALEQRFDRPAGWGEWDDACVSIADKIRKL